MTSTSGSVRAKLEQEFMTSRIWVQRENKFCQINLTPCFSEFSHLFDKVTSIGVQNSAKIGRSSGTNLCWRKCTHSPPALHATAHLSDREWHRCGCKCAVALGYKFSQALRTSVCYPSWHVCDMLSHSCRTKSIMDHGNGLLWWSSDGCKKPWQQQKKKKEEGNTLKLQINGYL